MNSLGPEHEMSAAEKEKLALLFSDEPSTLLYGGGGSGKILTPQEDYDKLAERLTSDDYGIKGVGHALRGDEAAAYGRAMLEDSVGGPEKLAELVEKLKKYRNS
jgi:hypothetical protein